MGPLEAILTPKRSQTQAETHFKVFLVRFYIGPQSIMRAEVGRDTFSDLDDTLPYSPFTENHSEKWFIFDLAVDRTNC